MVPDVAALKAECVNNPNNYSYTDPQSQVTLTLAQWFTAGADAVVASILNVVESAFFVYRTGIPVAEVFDAVVWANFTPSDAVPTDTALNLAIYQARQLACQTKQMNLQTILTASQGAVNGSKALTRAGLQDALTNLPSGTAGAFRSAGWVTIRDSVLARAATRAEKLYANKANGNGSTAQAAALLVFEGFVSAEDVQAARNLP